MTGVGATRILGAHPGRHHDAGSAQHFVAAARHFRIGVLDRRDDPRNAGRDDGLSAGRRLAVMRTRFERGVKCSATRGLAGTPQRFGLGMWTAARLRPAAADHGAILHNHRADRGIGPCIAESAPTERQRKLHEAQIVGCGHLRSGRTVLASSSPDNSLTAS